MLYDNALLLMTYTECYQMTKKPFYKQIAEEIITFVKKGMIGTDGAFYSAIDADSEGVEGKYLSGIRREFCRSWARVLDSFTVMYTKLQRMVILKE